MVMLIMKIRKKRCSASLFPAVWPPNLAPDPGSTSETVLGPPGVRGGIPLVGLNSKPHGPKHFTSAQQSLLDISWPWVGVLQTGGPWEASTYLWVE